MESLAEHGMPALKSSFYKLDRSADIFKLGSDLTDTSPTWEE